MLEKSLRDTDPEVAEIMVRRRPPFFQLCRLVPCQPAKSLAATDEENAKTPSD
jgi:hypothetical protein